MAVGPNPAVLKHTGSIPISMPVKLTNANKKPQYWAFLPSVSLLYIFHAHSLYLYDSANGSFLFS